MFNIKIRVYKCSLYKHLKYVTWSEKLPELQAVSNTIYTRHVYSYVRLIYGNTGKKQLCSLWSVGSVQQDIL
jgi:hypothetical protein